jgi:hypothetical protein
MTTAAHMAELTAQVLNHFADELAAATPQQLDHLAERAETLPASVVGDTMRHLVDDEYQRRRRDLIALHMHIAGCAHHRGCTGVTSTDLLRADEVIRLLGRDLAVACMTAWERAGYAGDWRDVQYGPAARPAHHGDGAR